MLQWLLAYLKIQCGNCSKPTITRCSKTVFILMKIDCGTDQVWQLFEVWHLTK